MTKGDEKTKLKNGWIHILMTLEIIGKPKEHVDETLGTLLGTIKEDERVHWLEEHREPADELKDGFFSAFAEVDLLVKDVETLTWLAANYTPASLEIIEPLEFHYTAGQMQAWYNDILSAIHGIAVPFRNQQSELQHIKGQLRTLVENSLLLSIARGHTGIAAIHRDTSIDKKAIEAHLEFLKKEGKVKEQKGAWKLA